MGVFGLIYRQYRWPLLGVLLLSAASAVLNVGVIAFIKNRLMDAEGAVEGAMLAFAGLLALLFALSFGVQAFIASLGHRFVHGLRRRLVKQVLDSDVDRLESLGSARLLASLSGDVQKITIGFINLPEIVYGSILTLAAFGYLAWLSLPLFGATLAWLALMVVVSQQLMRRTQAHMRQLREADDALHAHYRAVIEGRQELALNRTRAQHLYEQEYLASAGDYFHNVVRADTFHWSNSNWVNCMILASLALVFALVGGYGWADYTVASTFAVVILFVRAPLVSSMGAIPNLLGANVALEKLNALQLQPYREDFDLPAATAFEGWQRLQLDAVTYRYRSEDGSGFVVGPLDLTLQRGERVFLVGGNGSGKSTLARLITGLYRPDTGCLRVDGRAVGEHDLAAYQQLFSTVFSDFHLFRQLLGVAGEDAPRDVVQAWLALLRMSHKVRIEQARLLDLELSQGQRKRLGLLLAVLEGRGVLLLDEWAADQDPAYRRAFYQQLLPQLSEQGVTVIAITHDDHYFHLADRLLKMEGGQLYALPVPAPGEAQRGRALP